MGNQKKKVRALKFFIGSIVLIGLATFALRSFLIAQSEASLLSLRFETAAGVTPEFKVEVVNTPQDRARGLMFRKEMSASRGMLFIFPETQDHSFYMKNTYISLDIIFVSEDLKVVGSLENLPILNQQSRTIGKPSKYAIEFIAGTVEKLGIKPGDRVVIAGTLPRGT